MTKIFIEDQSTIGTPEHISLSDFFEKEFRISWRDLRQQALAKLDYGNRTTYLIRLGEDYVVDVGIEGTSVSAVSPSEVLNEMNKFYAHRYEYRR